ncbi:1-(5-phosphoribosyl)-5-[(5-phosphoribosylamino)methylideneamino]imidazole-4-carboxamide isomerase [Caloramator sp. E03]|uniref:1-(5-phosphoribosyl)-5-[(5- phosphoribosylamino)methylideneamino]imidazole-4- carboxamide isomerase n=1 Tax=Caloramator sp. E03 TaxID=2576307 RepID=UPI00111083DE|nr:1-(5-phosphoribosyl)-5-[(5-phosphoribosylamino)methylideneamino]imidazole-4-carboxamide isomerase [Caloramator sp. E03]QCX34564.1 1-(5-phosphoribosyl)-5-[(5-phosphoribosylamino)methylideneamino]imidazole-4-carboxamide isomerase [Caloramator sp. E03]
MIIFPAIDIKNGRCVRLTQGNQKYEEVFYDNPVDAAMLWEKLGAEYLHVVDLDGAFCGQPQNKHIVKNIIESVDIPLQLGGGIRTIKDIEEVISLGVKRVILGTAAISNKELIINALKEYGDNIAVSIDAKDGYAAINGWMEVSNKNAFDLAIELERLGLRYLIYTDILKDGMLSGPNFEHIRLLKNKTNLNIIVSGGISSADDLLELKKLGVYGAIVGKALYTGQIKDFGGIVLACKEDYSLS